MSEENKGETIILTEEYTELPKEMQEKLNIKKGDDFNGCKNLLIKKGWK